MIVDVQCGYNHTMLKTNKYNFYGFGYNTDNQLLINDSGNSKTVDVSTLKEGEYFIFFGDLSFKFIKHN